MTAGRGAERRGFRPGIEANWGGEVIASREIFLYGGIRSICYRKGPALNLRQLLLRRGSMEPKRSTGVRRMERRRAA